jgi:flavodoxin
MVFYFSGTGNSEYAAENLAAALGEKTVGMADALKSGGFCYEARKVSGLALFFRSITGGCRL